jgi:putative ABC transport system substrate-binding protein
VHRRCFLRTLGASLLATPWAVEAQQGTKVWRVALLFPSGPRLERAWQGFEQGLRDLNYVEGQNLAFVYGGTSPISMGDSLPVVARTVVRQNVDVIVTFGASGARAAKDATSTIPIVVLSVFDAVESGLVASLARPGGNVTGISLPYRDVAAKRLELLKVAIPKLMRVAFLTTGRRGGYTDAGRAMEAGADALSLKLTMYEINADHPRDLDRAFAGMKTARVEALVVSEAGELSAEFRRIARLARIHRLPSIGAQPLVEDGGLMGYSANLLDTYRRGATFVAKILGGARPGDLPMEQPSKFELVINLKTAKVLGLTIPPPLLLQADRMIE